MSVGVEQARSFIEPLRGKTITFLVNDRQTNLSLMRGITAVATAAGRGCTIFDIDALFSSNAEEILSWLPSDAAKRICIRVPEPLSNIESELSKVFRSDSGVFMIQSLNTLFHLFQSSGVGSRTRKVAFAMISLSYFAKSGDKVILVTMYGRNKVIKVGGSISDFSDATVTVANVRHGVSLRCERGLLWPDGEFYLRLP